MEKRSTLADWITKRPRKEQAPTKISGMHNISSNCRNSVDKKIDFLSQEVPSDALNISEGLVEERISNFVNLEIESSNVISSVSESEVEEIDKYSFLSPPKDSKKRDRNDLNYDKTTLYIPESSFKNMTNCEEQFWRIKMECFDAIVFFKKGKFYELFSDDAVLSSELFGLKLTKRGSMKMTGIPEMSLEEWTSRFVEKGYKVAIVDQKESGVAQNIRVKSGEIKKSVIERELKEIVTEITSSQEGLSICAVTIASHATKRHKVSLAIFYPMESEFTVQTFEDTEEFLSMKSIVKKENVKEVLSSETLPLNEKRVSIREDFWKQNVSAALEKISASILPEAEQASLKALISYLQYLKYSFTPNLRRQDTVQKYMYIDGTTIETLSLVKTSTEQEEEKETVFSQIDRTSTKMGKRLLRKWLVSPLYKLEEIEERYNSVEALLALPSRYKIVSDLKKISDINDLVKKGKNKKIGQKEIKRLSESLLLAEKVSGALKESAGLFFNPTNTKLPSIISQIEKYIVHSEIVDGFDISGDISLLQTDKRLVEAKKNRQGIIALLDKYAEKESTLCNQIFTPRKVGKEYFLETKEKKALPGRFSLAANTKSLARYSTAETKRYSELFLEAEERIFMLGQDCVSEIANRISEHENELQAVANGVAELDCFISFGEISGARPKYSKTLKIANFTNIAGTHIPNSMSVDATDKLIVVTGPNMGGKSTLLRNISICIILRQIGVLLPAEHFEGPLYDRVFTRIGAADSLINGESTFQIEMKETANILNYATENSFVIVDELGRGTSTREGCAISTAVKSYLKKIKCTAFFSTHFFKSIFSEDRAIKMDYKSTDKGEIIYLYKAAEGLCSDSCGINICRIAKVPSSVIERAEEIKSKRGPK